MTLQLPGRTAHGVTTRLVGSYPTFSPLPRVSEAVIFFCVFPAVTDTLHINKRDALCCPDFPHTPCGASDKPSNCFQNAKLVQGERKNKSPRVKVEGMLELPLLSEAEML